MPRRKDRIVDEANDRAEQITADAKQKADAMMDEVTVEHDALVQKNREEIEKEHQNLLEAKKQVADFKKALFDMYKEHLAMLSEMPEEDDDTFGMTQTKKTAAKEPKIPTAPSHTDPFASTQFSAKAIQGAYESRFGDLKEDDADSEA